MVQTWMQEFRAKAGKGREGDEAGRYSSAGQGREGQSFRLGQKGSASAQVSNPFERRTYQLLLKLPSSNRHFHNIN